MGLLLIGGWAAMHAPLAWGQEEITRKVKSKVAPVYPELARRMNITGVVKVQITVAAERLGQGRKAGRRTSGVGECRTGCSEEVALRDRVRKSQPGIVEFRFDPAQ